MEASAVPKVMKADAEDAVHAIPRIEPFEKKKNTAEIHAVFCFIRNYAIILQKG